MYVISYDISSDKIRKKTADVLMNYGKRIQYSVFECDLTKSRFDKLYGELCKLSIGEEEFNIRFYSICENCAKKILVIGDIKENEKYSRDEVIIV